jgi:HEAT repeat protein
MLRTFLADRSFLIRLATARHLVTLSEDWTNELLESALRDPFTNIRTIALKELIRRDRATPALLTLGLTDPSYDVRDMAVKCLDLSRDALVEHYRAHLKGGDQVVGCLLGLRDVNGREYMTDILPYTAHSDPTVRQAALMALAKLAPDQAYDHAMSMIVDRNKRIRTKAESILLARHDQAVAERARTLMVSEQVMHRLAGLSLLHKFGGWGSLPDTLTACLDGSPRVAEQAWVNLNAWVVYARRLFTDARTQDVERARTALSDVRARLGQPTDSQQRTLDTVQVFLN